MKPRVLIAIVAVLVIVAIVVVSGRRREFFYAGTVEATEVDLSARLSTVIDQVNVREGDKVKRNQLLVRLSGEDTRLAAQQAERDYRRASELLQAGSMTQDNYDKLKYRRDDAFVRLSWTTICSPINGTILSRYHEPGEMVAPGTKLLTLADLETVWAYVYVPQPMLGKISVGMQVPVFVPENNMRQIEGKIVKINQEAEFTPKNVQTRKERTRLVYGVKIEFNNAEGLLKPGMSVEAKLPQEGK